MKNGSYGKFIGSTILQRPVDIKKLDYIYKSIKNYLDFSQKNIEDISILEGLDVAKEVYLSCIAWL